jgi:hypothetical protein
MHVIYARPPLGKSFLERSGIIVGCSHLSGLVMQRKGCGP